MLSLSFQLSTLTSQQFHSFHCPSPNHTKHRHHYHHFHSKTTSPTAIKMTTTSATTPNLNPNQDQQRLQELKSFDESKIGVKGLVDRGLTTIPSFFIHQNNTTRPDPDTKSGPKTKIPVIDFSSPRSTVVDQIRQSSSDLGFFQIINHSIPQHSISSILNSMKAFNEQPEDIRTRYYRRDMAAHGVGYSTNFDLYNSKAASWRDTLQLRLGPTPPDWDHVPQTCIEAIQEWDEAVQKIGEELLEMLCEGLGVEKNSLKGLSCLDARVLVGHYYPYCPQPELTAGLTSHTDPGVLTVLVQNEVLGLQVKVGEEWVDVEPVEGAIVINIGDILQIMSNDVYKSVEHRVLANPFPEPRVSVAVFFNPSQRDNLFGPLPELVSAEKPALYRQFTFMDYMRRFFSKELDGKTLTNFYRL